MSRLWLSAGMVIAGVCGLYFGFIHKPRKAALKIWIPKPITMAPEEHDLAVHHITQRPVLATLVSQYKSGEFMGVLAKGWSVSADKRVWKFQLRDGLRFENGTPLTSADVKRSLTRMAFLMKRSKSRSVRLGGTATGHLGLYATTRIVSYGRFLISLF
jgi:ABC-type transport system substrate-binding protein